MPFALRYLYIASATLLLTACFAPVSQTPHIAGDELNREHHVHESIVDGKQQPSNGEFSVTSEPSSADRRKRVTVVGKRITDAGKAYCNRFVKGETNCIYPIKIQNQDIFNAFADGDNLHITTKMLDSFPDEDHLATILAHEYAHNLMRHVEGTMQNVTAGAVVGTLLDALAASQGVQTRGQFRHIGEEAAYRTYNKDFEREADYVGLYVLYHAGYNIKKAPDIWRKMTSLSPDGRYGGSSHPMNAERYLMLQKTVDEIYAKKAAKQPIEPDLKPKEG